MPNIPRDVKRYESIANMNTLLMKRDEIFRTISPRVTTSELFSYDQRIHFKKYVGVSPSKRTSQTFKQCNIFSLIVAIFTPEVTARSERKSSSSHENTINYK